MIGWRASEAKRLRDLLGKKPEELSQRIAKRWSQTLFQFIGKIQKEQMTGRPGLKVFTGNLRRSWFPVVEIAMGKVMDVVSKVFTDVKYARVHQDGAVIHQKGGTRNAAFKVSKRGVHYFAKENRATIRKAVSSGNRTIRIPKRLRVIEAYQEAAFPQMVDDVRQAMREVARQ